MEIALCYTEYKLHTFFSIASTDTSSLAIKSEETLNRSVPNMGNAREIFPNHAFIIVLASISTLLTIMCETFNKKNYRSNQGFVASFLKESEAMLMIRVNSICVVILFVMLLYSAERFILIFSEDCEMAFGTEGAMLHGGNEITLCEALKSCDSEIASVIDPPEPYVQDFRSITISLAVLLLFSAIIKPRVYNQGDDPNVHPLNENNDNELDDRREYDNSRRSRIQRQIEDLIIQTREGQHQQRGSGTRIRARPVSLGLSDTAAQLTSRFGRVSEQHNALSKCQQLHKTPLNDNGEEIACT
jgi:hypothetical protein